MPRKILWNRFTLSSPPAAPRILTLPHEGRNSDTCFRAVFPFIWETALIKKQKGNPSIIRAIRPTTCQAGQEHPSFGSARRQASNYNTHGGKSMSQPLIDLVNITRAMTAMLSLTISVYLSGEFLRHSSRSKWLRQDATTLRIIGGFESPDKGGVIFGGKDITKLLPNKRQLNTVFQKYALFPHMSIADNIAFGLKIKNKPKNYIEDKIKYALKLVNLPGGSTYHVRYHRGYESGLYPADRYSREYLQ